MKQLTVDELHEKLEMLMKLGCGKARVYVHDYGPISEIIYTKESEFFEETVTLK